MTSMVFPINRVLDKERQTSIRGEMIFLRLVPWLVASLLCPSAQAFHFTPAYPRRPVTRLPPRLHPIRTTAPTPRLWSSRSPLGPINPETLAAPPPEQVGLEMSCTPWPQAWTDGMVALSWYVQVLKAVERAGYRVTSQDVAALAGIDLSTAQKVRNTH